MSEKELHSMTYWVLSAKKLEHAVAQLVEALCCKPQWSQVRFPMVLLEFFIDTVFQAALWPLTEMSTRNISWGVKAAGA